MSSLKPFGEIEATFGGEQLQQFECMGCFEVTRLFSDKNIFYKTLDTCSNPPKSLEWPLLSHLTCQPYFQNSPETYTSFDAL